MKTVFIIWNVLAVMYLISWGIIITPILLDAVKYMQTKIHNWANQ